MPAHNSLKHRPLLAAVATLAVWASSLSAQSAPPQTDCGNATSTAAMRQCASARYTKAETELRAVRDKLLEKLDESAKAKLVASQSAWVQFRKANAEFQAGLVKGGTLAPLVQITVMADMTEARAAELKKALEP